MHFSGKSSYKWVSYNSILSEYAILLTSPYVNWDIPLSDVLLTRFNRKALFFYNVIMRSSSYPSVGPLFKFPYKYNERWNHHLIPHSKIYGNHVSH